MEINVPKAFVLMANGKNAERLISHAVNGVNAMKAFVMKEFAKNVVQLVSYAVKMINVMKGYVQKINVKVCEVFSFSLHYRVKKSNKKRRLPL